MSIQKRTTNLIGRYQQIFSQTLDKEKTILISAPGRAEILGNHTDYNQGYTLSANISCNLLLLGERRRDNKVKLYSLNQVDKIQEFTIGSSYLLEKQKAKLNQVDAWINYVEGVIWAFSKRSLKIPGFNAIIESTIPIGTGVSSSAALELATAHFIYELLGQSLSPLGTIKLCRYAENKYVGAACGYLDQATVELADRKWLFLSHRPQNNQPFTFRLFSTDIAKLGYAFVIGFDPQSKHSIVTGKYAIRKKACEEALPIFSSLLRRNIKSLRDVSLKEFKDLYSDFLTLTDRKIKDANMDDKQFWKLLSPPPSLTLAKWVSHIIYENDRVSKAINALQRKDIKKFGNLLTASGKSAIYNFDIAEDTPELKWVFETIIENKDHWGVLGIRNMGGGFNATTLALLKTPMIEHYKTSLSKHYRNRLNRPYLFIDFVPSASVRRIALKN